MLDVVVTDGNYSRQARQKFWGWILQNCYLLIKKKKKKRWGKKNGKYRILGVIVLGDSSSLGLCFCVITCSALWRERHHPKRYSLLSWLPQPVPQFPGLHLASHSSSGIWNPSQLHSAANGALQRFHHCLVGTAKVWGLTGVATKAPLQKDALADK